jgi:hypothetical protein
VGRLLKQPPEVPRRGRQDRLAVLVSWQFKKFVRRVVADYEKVEEGEDGG